MEFGESVKTVFKKYSTFSGRASRSEFWYFCLFNFLAGVFFGVIEAGHIVPQGGADTLSLIYNLAIFLPSLAVTARRLHDTDRSGWWMLIAITIIGIIPLIIWYCSKGTEGNNRFGEDPLRNEIKQ